MKQLFRNEMNVKRAPKGLLIALLFFPFIISMLLIIGIIAIYKQAYVMGVLFFMTSIALYVYGRYCDVCYDYYERLTYRMQGNTFVCHYHLCPMPGFDSTPSMETQIQCTKLTRYAIKGEKYHFYGTFLEKRQYHKDNLVHEIVLPMLCDEALDKEFQAFLQTLIERR